ncbi:MAG: type I restriction endonuclease subunit R [Halanaerobiales bacterium]|nr:type I restriction endonuclease subunit R [Halanaerobiales bacterium]
MYFIWVIWFDKTTHVYKKYFTYLISFYLAKHNLDGSGKKRKHTVHYINFKEPIKNDFLVVRQLRIQGINKSCYPDLIIYINGIPIVVVECKSPFKENQSNVKVGKKDAFEQLQRYMNLRQAESGEGIEQLFYTNFFIGILNKYHGYAGTISSKYNHYLEWKDPYPLKKDAIHDVENNGQNIFLQGLLEKENLLDIMKNFILFETEESKRIKRIARYQQFRAVNKAFRKILIGKTSLKKGGVIWHTQGSGKSLSMVMLVGKIRRKSELRNCTIVVVTDRVDLDKQIYNTFVRNFSELANAKKNEDKILVCAENIQEMTDLLKNAQPKIIMTTIHKFQSKKDKDVILEDGMQRDSLFFEKEIEVLTTKENVIVMTDEAHRSQYNSLARNMRIALPNATFIGFTGTPIEKDDKNTYRTFGELIDCYSIQEAVEDGATVGIIYEGRKPELQIKAENLKKFFDETFDDYTDEEKEAIKQKYVTKLAIAEADERIEEIAIDILKHYLDHIYPNGFKAQIVCVSRTACVKYYNAIMKHMKDILGVELEAKIIYSSKQNDKPYLKDHSTTKAEQAKIIARFIQPIKKDKLCFLIVKDMLLTGFDAPIEQVMYLDRPLREHNLLQAIARVNRTYSAEDKFKDDKGEVQKKQRVKNYGFVVDYYGITEYLEEALKIFDKKDIGEPMEDIDVLYNKMLDYKEAVMNMFNGVDKNNIDSVMRVIEPENKRAEFELAYKRYSSAVDALMPNHVSKQDLDNLKWLSYIRAGAKARFEPEKDLDISDCGEKVRELISTHLKSKGVEQWIKPITLFGKDFTEKIKSLKSDEAIASSMEHAIRHVITAKMEDDPVYYTSLLEKLEKILEVTRHNYKERKEYFEELIEKGLKIGQEDEAKKLGFDDKREYALFGIIKSVLCDENETVHTDEKNEVSYISQEIIEFSKNIALDVSKTIINNSLKGWTKNIAKSNEMETVVYKMLIKKYHKVGIDKLEKMKKLILNIAKRHYANFD